VIPSVPIFSSNRAQESPRPASPADPVEEVAYRVDGLCWRFEWPEVASVKEVQAASGW
jgi:hypothetical protein